MTARVAVAIQALAVAVWLGGLTVLGAIVAPTIFRNVPAPTSADAMTLVFRRFDYVAMSCSAIVLAMEAWRAFARLDGVRMRVDTVRVIVAAVAAGLAVFEGIVVSPKIAQLHHDGAVRGLGALGEQLESVHKLAESAAKAELVLLVILLAIAVAPRAAVSR